MHTSTKLALITAVLACAAACQGPGLDVPTWQPATVDTGAARAVRIVDGEGRAESVAAAQVAAMRALSSGFYDVHAAFRVQLDVDGRRAVLADGAAMDPRALYLRLDVLEDFAEISEEARDGVDEYGDDVTAIVDVTHAHAVVDATLVRGADGAVLWDRFEVEGIHDEDGDVVDSAMDAAMADAVSKIAQEMTPTRDEDFVPFDDRDEAERPILLRADDDLVGAIGGEDAYMAAHPDRAAPRYNRAVMLEARGDFDGAVAGYDDAMAAHPDDKLCAMIGAARAACLARRDTARSLGL